MDFNKSNGLPGAEAIFNLAEEACNKLADVKRSVADRTRYADQARCLVSTILAMAADVDPAVQEQIGERLVFLVKDMLEAMIPLMMLGDDGYSLHEVHAKLDLVADLMGAVDAVARSDALLLSQKEMVADAAQSVVSPALYLLVRLVDPSRHEFEWIDDFSVRVGHEVMSIAWRVSAITDYYDREARYARSMT